MKQILKNTEKRAISRRKQYHDKILGQEEVRKM